MSIAFRPSTPEDLPGIISLLQAAFSSPPDAPYLNPALLRWKYFEASQSYVLARDGRLLAHGCAWPVTRLDAVCLIDWAGAPDTPGMGIMLARKLGQLFPVMLSIGGSEMTQQIMPRIGFKKKSDLLTYARVLRPWRQFRTRPGRRSPKALLRYARNWVWSMSPPALTRGWTAAPLPASVRCPTVDVASYQLVDQDRTVGSFFLTRVGGQARLARLDTQSDLEPAYAVAVEVALHDHEAVELIALAHDGRTRMALEANSFRQRAKRSVFVFDPQHRLGREYYPLPLDMLDDDLFYMNTPEYPYLT